MSRLTLIIITLGIQGSCRAQNLAGQVFILSKDFLEDKCEVSAPCDCCATDLFFLTEKEFGMVNRCLYHDSYYRGKYAISRDKLTLIFEQKVANENIDEVTQKATIAVTSIELTPYTFTIDHCGNKVRLRHSTIVDFSNGSRYEAAVEKKSITKLKNEPAWELVRK